MNFSVSSFLENFFAPARPTLFRVSLNFPGTGIDARDEFSCKGASIPTRTVGLIELSYQGRKAGFPGDSTFDEWTITIYNDIGFTLRRKFEQWCEIINGAKDNISKVSPTEWKRDFIVEQLDGENRVLKTYIARGCWPTSSGDVIDLSWENNDQAEEYSVTFHLDWWETPDVTRSIQ